MVVVVVVEAQLRQSVVRFGAVGEEGGPLGELPPVMVPREDDGCLRRGTKRLAESDAPGGRGSEFPGSRGELSQGKRDCGIGGRREDQLVRGGCGGWLEGIGREFDQSARMEDRGVRTGP